MMRPTPYAKVAGLTLGLAICAMPGPGQAHHSFAMFDSARIVTLKGTIKEFQWTNPHVILWVYTSPPSGPAEVWSVELTSPGNLSRQGWSRQSIKVGDKVTVDINPLRNGEHGGGFKQLVLAETGEKFSGGVATSVTR